MNARNWMQLALLGAVWGGSVLFAKIAVAEIPPLVLVFLRVSLACLVLNVVMRATGHIFPRNISLAASFLFMGLLNNAIPFSLLFWGQTALSAGLAAILNATTPIFTFLFASVAFHQEEVRLNRIAGVLLGFSGVILMLSASLGGFDQAPLWAQFACLGAAVSYALAATFAKRFKCIPPLVSATGQLSGSTILILPLAVISLDGWSPAEVSAEAWLSATALGVGATAFAYLLYFRLLSDAGATNASLVTLFVPATAILFGFLLLGQTISAHEAGGLGLLLAGLLVLDGRVLKRIRSR
ncbi:putative membrane protein [Roseibium hamelinense]|uniref:Putative membrane protein n=1 Tax=Roseibium hamelinense TaxID=150831 RepID=A0A562SM76_9HYPH|nr:DMT family transporter [Roseibium hamelinense]MTI44952.1 DMT family transporter [Roseibium hamelinense]TWI82213.1 putative membrane protein [Roseibium hamelinense]